MHNNFLDTLIRKYVKQCTQTLPHGYLHALSGRNRVIHFNLSLNAYSSIGNARFTHACIVTFFFFTLFEKSLNEHIICSNFFIFDFVFKCKSIIFSLIHHCIIVEKLITVITQSYLFLSFAFIFTFKHIFCIPEKPQ